MERKDAILVKNDQMTKSNFGATGWWYIILTGLMFFMCTGLGNDGLNVSVAKFGEVHGWAQTQLLNFSTIGGYVAIVATPFLSKMLHIKGTRFSATLTLLVAAAATAWWGMSGSQAQYLIACAICSACTNFYGHICSTTLANSWFPKKKGLFLGWSTMGLQLSSVAFVAILSWLFSSFGLSGAYFALAIFQVVLAALVFFTVRDTPAELGKYPDNIPMSDEELKEYLAEEKSYVSKLKLWRILISREVWFVGIGFGIIYMASVGLLSQWVPRLMTLGYEQNYAILTLSIASAIGFFGSYAYGWLDMKIGPKKASVCISINYVLALIFTVLPFNSAFLYISVFLIGIGIGGVANLVGSLVGTIFGPKEFPRVFGIVNTIESVIRVTAFSVLAFGLENFGGYTGAYLVFLVLVVLGTVLLCFVREHPPGLPTK